MTSLYESERDRATTLQSKVDDLTTQNREAEERIAQLTNAEKNLTDKTRDLVRIHVNNLDYGLVLISSRNEICATRMPLCLS